MQPLIDGGLPHAVVELLVGEHLPGILGQKGQQIEFQGRERGAGAPVAHFPQPQIDLQLAEAEDFGRVDVLVPLDPQTKTQLQFHQGIGLGQIVVSACHQTPDAVVGLGIGGQKDDRDPAEFPQAAAHGHAVHSRHVHIQHHRVQSGGGRGFQSVRAVFRPIDLIALLFQERLIGRLDVGVVIHQ